VLLVDQVVKWGMTAWIGPDAARHRVDLVGGIVGFEYVQNTGAAFGILAGQPLLLAIFAVLATALFLGMMRTALRTHMLVPIAVGLVLGGAIGNLLDRIRMGYVVDFVAVGRFPRFNVADSAITIGLLLMAWAALREDAAMAPEPENDSTETEAAASTPPSTNPQSMRNGSHA
jgi:signal peptidase II